MYRAINIRDTPIPALKREQRGGEEEPTDRTTTSAREGGSYLSVTLTPFAAAASVIDAHLDFEAAR
jgi:hypothetical protein